MATQSQPDASTWKMSDFEMKETVGVGTFGRVRFAVHQPTGCPVAIKALKKSALVQMSQVEHVLAEKAILREVNHPFAVNMLTTFQDTKRLYIVMEFVAGGELFSQLRMARKFPNDVAKFYAAEVILVFEHLHERNVCYRDLKPENLLLDNMGHIKLTDFGFAKKVPGRTFTLCGTPEYLAPEIIQSRGHNKAVDWWTLGILIFEMLVGYPPFFAESHFTLYETILEGKLQFPKYVCAPARNIIRALLTQDPTRRLGNLKNGTADVKKHKWFSGVDWDRVLAKAIPAPVVPRMRSGPTSCYERYEDSVEDPRVGKLTAAQQELFKGFELM
eukprot:NODE_286_length_1719_cov_80.238065_g257_i0.p1 GENE.NODE_286_length_1719_cov_80.238065_g257_i0~~NODE_286_length_1719_cov_80.238065_g257_i0.p1  ORF type:complete len:330 (+),score=38.26 NODE_286_length_1719_cov_80.238065_g257_i0:83-1072(+)